MSGKIEVSVVLPTYNEGMNIKNMVSSILKNVKAVEVIVVDDDSPDKTWKIVDNMHKKNVRLIRRLNERGLASAIAKGINESKGDIIVWMDADLSMPANLIPKMISKIYYGYDIAIGSRYVKGGKDTRGFTRRLTSRMINLFANILLNFKVRDYDTGFVAVKKRVFNKVKLSKEGYGDYCIEFLYEAGEKGYKIAEIPFIFTERKQGESKTADYISSIIKYGIVYVRRIVKLRLNRSKYHKI